MSSKQVKPAGTVQKMASDEVHSATPALGWYTDHVLFHQIWARPGLSPRDRSLLVISALITCGQTPQLVSHFGRALSNGLRPVEIAEVVSHLAFFAGWPCAMSAVPVMRQVFAQRGLNPDESEQTTGEAIPPAVGSRRAILSDFSGPCCEMLVECAGDVLEGLWRRTELTPRDRSFSTIVSLIASGQLGQLKAFARRGLDDGLTIAELAEAVSHLAFYAGLGKAKAAADILDDL